MLTLPAPGVNPASTWRLVRIGSTDPTARVRDGELVKAWHTPDGPATLRLRLHDGTLRADAWGPGAGHALASAPALAGLYDTPPDLHPPHAAVRAAFAHLPGMRLPRLPWVADHLLGTILQQRVTFHEAAASWRQLVLRHGETAPGPWADHETPLHLAPTPAVLRRLGPGGLRDLNVDRQRAGTLLEASFHTRKLNLLTDADAARALFAHLPGVGPWTTGSVCGFVFADPDAVITGDVHLPHTVAYALTGDPRADDAALLRLLEPYAGQRFRVLKALMVAGRKALPR